MTILLETINIFVKNMSQTIQFYKLLGLKFNDGDEKKSYVKVSFSGIFLCFYEQEIVTDYFKTINFGSSNNFELSFRVKSASKVDELYNTLMNAGYQEQSFKKPSNADWGQRTAFILDPDGNLIEICAHL